MKNLLKIWNISWFHFENPQKQELIEIWDDYDLHEIIIDDIIQKDLQDKIDVYDKHLFMITHFPKFDKISKTYLTNELKFILWKNFIITISSIKSNNIEKIKKEYIEETEKIETQEKYKITPYYIFYKIIDSMYDKSIKILENSSKDIIVLEEEVFSKKWLSQKLLEDIMKKRRNLIQLKHIFHPQQELLQELQKEIENFYNWELDLYFEDLLYKLDKIESKINIQINNITSLNDTYNSIMNIKLNSMLTTLTIFTLIIWTLTFIVWVYGMNIALPMQNNKWAFYIISFLMLSISILIWIFFKKKWWF